VSSPASALPSSGRGAPPYPDTAYKVLWDWLSAQPTIPIPVLSTSASAKIYTRPCLLVGWSLRETTGAAAAQAEFWNGADTTGELVAEVTIPAPLPGSVGNTDTDVDASATGAASAMAPSLAGVAGQTTFVTGFEVTGGGATAGSIIVATLTGILGGTKSYDIAIPAGITLGITPLVVQFPRPIPASALNTAITLNVPSFGAGNTNAAATLHGFQRLIGSTGAQTGQAPSQNLPGNGLLLRSGLFMRMITGTVVGAIWIKG
jgi:hypothetical protein